MILNIDEYEKVVGEIYKITNNITNKSYIGQTRSHRLNHKKYRPFGYLGRMKDHVFEANSNKKKQCKYLNSAILKYGEGHFTCEKLLSCNVSELDEYEKKYISEHNTKYPNGYNLTNGGKGFTDINGKYICDTVETISEKPEKPKRNKIHSSHTKSLISERLKNALSSKNHRIKMMKNTQNQHFNTKFEKFKNEKIDETNIDQYINIIHSNGKIGTHIRITINKKQTTFVGKYSSVEELSERARQFIFDLIKWQHDQIAGNS
jgi:hypothetical protein